MEKTPILPPFKRFCVTIGNLPSSYVDSMSYYECLMWLCKYLKDTVVPAVNENAEAVNELINWFNNLDIQDEVDNKLDEMVESGQLQEIISVYLNSKAIFGFNTIDDMINSENLINGSYARTCGSTTYNNGYGALYKIRTITNDDVVDGVNIIAMETDDSLIAELIVNTNLGTYKDEITTELSDGIIVIGDSYTDTSNQGLISWATLFKNNIGYDSTNFFVSAYGGTGFVPNSNLSFLTLLQDLNNTITDKSKIKRIYVLGGYNDQVFTATQIWNGLQAFMTYAKATYPNATVYVGCVGYSTGENDSGTREALYTKAITTYKRVNEIGGVYMFNRLHGTQYRTV